MGYHGLKRNGSGYYDETAFKAIKETEGLNTKDAKAGDIWANASGREFLVIKNHGGFCTSLQLLEESKRSGEICVTSRAKRYTHPGMLQYTFETLLKTFVKALPEDEFKTVIHAVENALSINISVNEVMTEDQLKSFVELDNKCDSLQWDLENAKREANYYKQQYESVSANGDGIPWKQMYDDLVDKLVKRM